MNFKQILLQISMKMVSQPVSLPTPILFPILFCASYKSRTVTKNYSTVAILLAYKNAEISLYKIGLSKDPALSDISNHDFDRIGYLHTCLQSVKSFFDIYLNLPLNKTHCLSVPIITHFTWSLGVLQLLTTFKHPDWNLEWARSTISFTDVLGKLSEKYGQVKAALGLDPHTPIGEDVFSHSGRRMSWMKTFFENGGINPRLQDNQQYQNSVNISEISLGNDIDLLDDEWLRDLMELW